MFLSNVIHQAESFKDFTKKLKDKAPIYPKIHIEGTGDIEGVIAIAITTLVKFRYKERDFLRHHVQYHYACNLDNDDSYNLSGAVARLKEDCGMTIASGVPVGGYDDLIPENSKSNSYEIQDSRN